MNSTNKSRKHYSTKLKKNEISNVSYYWNFEMEDFKKNFIALYIL